MATLSVNTLDWDADTRSVSLTLNSTDHCLDMWRAVLEVGAPTVSASAGADFQTLHLGANQYRYTPTGSPSKNIQFDSTTGQVAVNL